MLGSNRSFGASNVDSMTVINTGYDDQLPIVDLEQTRVVVVSRNKGDIAGRVVEVISSSDRRTLSLAGSFAVVYFKQLNRAGVSLQSLALIDTEPGVHSVARLIV